MTNRPTVSRYSLGVMAALAALAVAVPATAQPVNETLTWNETLDQCAACHGADGKGIRELRAPRLAGQGKRYLAEQLRHFAQGRRGTHAEDISGQTMAASATMLDEDTIMRLADYFAGLDTETEASPAPKQADGLEAPGARLYAANCAVCHGPSAEGSDALYVPNLMVLDAAYLRRQIEAYQLGWRGGPGASTRAKGMREMSFQLTSPGDIDDVVEYLSGVAETPQGDVTEL